MRLWSIHPKYLDTKGLLALWREALLAKAVLEEKTIGYKNHSQLKRFKKCKNPLIAINYYLWQIWKEADKRGYKFKKEKIEISELTEKISLTSGQVHFEFQHLLKKLQKRDLKKFEQIKMIEKIEINPTFYLIYGKIEDWEIIK